jgi:Na+-driven multidrug efflux pump
MHFRSRRQCRPPAPRRQARRGAFFPGAFYDILAHMRRSNRASMTILQLVEPIFIENILHFSLMSVDVFMLSPYSANARTR